jgi:uncharacterized protein with HEPN domain
MAESRLPDYLEQMGFAAGEALEFLVGMEKSDFLRDRKTQQAVVMNLLIVGEAASRIMDKFPEFVLANKDVPWRNMRGMRNRMAHGYFQTDMDLVFDTAVLALPGLILQIAAIQRQGIENSHH